MKICIIFTCLVIFTFFIIVFNNDSSANNSIEHSNLQKIMTICPANLITCESKGRTGNQMSQYSTLISIAAEIGFQAAISKVAVN